MTGEKEKFNKSTSRQVHKVKEILVHEEFWYYLRNDADLAIIVLEKDVTFSRSVRPVCLPNRNALLPRNGELISWNGDNSTRKSRLPIFTRDECVRNEPSIVNVLYERNFCAGKKGVYVTMADAGHGFYVKINEKYYLRGFVSAYRTDKLSDLAVYVDIYKFRKFLNHNNVTNIDLNNIDQNTDDCGTTSKNLGFVSNGLETRRGDYPW